MMAALTGEVVFVYVAVCVGEWAERCVFESMGVCVCAVCAAEREERRGEERRGEERRGEERREEKRRGEETSYSTGYTKILFCYQRDSNIKHAHTHTHTHIRIICRYFHIVSKRSSKFHCKDAEMGTECLHRAKIFNSSNVIESTLLRMYKQGTYTL